MARPREFDTEVALDAALAVFREHGFEGASAVMLLDAMRIGRQSLYNTFGDKWQLYLAALRRYGATETSAHLAALKQETRAIDGIKIMVARVVAGARLGCLGVNSVCEFGRREPEINEIHASAGQVFRQGLLARIEEAQLDGDLTHELTPEAAADFLSASFAGIRLAARGGASDTQLESLGHLALRALA